MQTQVDPAFDHAIGDTPCLFVDAELRVVRATAGVPGVLAVDEDDRGRALAEIADRSSFEHLAEDARRAMEEPTSVERVVTRDGGSPVLTRVMPDRDSEGEIVGATVSFIQYGGRLQMEKELRDSNILAATIVETLHEPIVILTSRFDVLMVNPAFYRHFRVAPEDTIGKKIYELGDGQWDIPDLRKLLEDVLPWNRSFKGFEVQHRFDGLGERTMTINARRLDHVQKILLGIRDVTEERQVAEQLRQRQKLEAVGRLAGGVAHDFNNLLTAATGHASILLEETPADSELRGEVEALLRIGRRAAELTRNLMAFSRDQVLERRPVDLGDIACEIEAMLTRLIPERIRLGIDLPAEAVAVQADPGQVQQVLVNLVINAADAITDGGRIDIEVDRVELTEDDADAMPWSAEPGSFGRLTVRDTGAGMTPEVQERIFEPFFTTKKEGSGTGLGLSTVFGIVKQHDGHILVETAPGKGSTFRVLLPAASQPPADRSPAPAAVSGRPHRAKTDRTILVVEDDDAVRHVTRRMLERAGYTVVEAASGEEALEVLDDADRTIHLVLSDVVMPALDGVEFGDALKARRPELPLIFMSGYSEGGLHSDIHDLANAFVPKPFTRDGLLACVDSVLGEDD